MRDGGIFPFWEYISDPFSQIENWSPVVPPSGGQSLFGAWHPLGSSFMRIGPQSSGEDSQGAPTRSNAPATSITLAGTQVDGSNPDIFGDGTASFDASTGTLTLNNFAAIGNDKGGPMLTVPSGNLTLQLEGNNALVAGEDAWGIFVLG